MIAQMECRVCGWWPPVVRVRNDRTEPAPEAWRWGQLVDHVIEQAIVEYEDGRDDGAHVRLEAEIDALA